MRNMRSALRSSRPSTLMNSDRPSSASAKYGVELRASTPARVSRASGTPARAMAATTAGPARPLVGRAEDEQHRRAADDAGAQREHDVQRPALRGGDAEDDRR